jgi:Putative zinc-finger
VSDTNGMRDEGPSFHLSDLQIAAYLENEMEEAERRSTEVHLDVCSDCRTEVIEARRTLDAWMGARNGAVATVGSRRMWRLGLAGTLLAASLATILIVRPFAAPADDPRRPARAADAPYTEGLTPITALAPANGATASVPLTFTWGSVGTTRYRLTVSDTDGAPLWTRDVVDTTAVLPPSVKLETGRVYFWNVDGLGAGVTATTGTRRFKIGSQ